MSRTDLQKSKFFNELSAEEQKEYFGYVEQYRPAIDNIYYTVSLRGDDEKDEEQARNLKWMFGYFSILKDIALKTRQPASTDDFEGMAGLQLSLKSYAIYKYCLSCPDLFDIFIVEHLPNERTPRVAVQIRSYGLWLYGVDEMLFRSFKAMRGLFHEFGMDPDQVCENRIDYCYHTNHIFHPEKLFSDASLEAHMRTTLTRYHFTGRIHKGRAAGACSELTRDYCGLGERKSNFVFVRFYNKALEVVEMGYKAYFWKMWYEAKLISFYDKYCFEYAYKEQNFDYVHKARLYFYLQYGKNAAVKKQFEDALADPNLNLRDYKAIADSYTPALTTVFNIEFETKRKFYYLSDNFIEALPFISREPLNDMALVPLRRLFRIIDNRKIFLNYLSDNTLRFVEVAITEAEEETMCGWWLRLRNTKLDDCLPASQKLLRVYSNQLDREIQKKKFMRAIARDAVLNGSVETCFEDDLSSMLSNLNDNHKGTVSLDFGEDKFDSFYLADYQAKKQAYLRDYKNRLENESTKKTGANE